MGGYPLIVEFEIDEEGCGGRVTVSIEKSESG